MNRYRIVHEQRFDSQALLIRDGWYPERWVSVFGWFGFWLRFRSDLRGHFHVVFSQANDAREFLVRIAEGAPRSKTVRSEVEEVQP